MPKNARTVESALLAEWFDIRAFYLRIYLYINIKRGIT